MKIYDNFLKKFQKSRAFTLVEMMIVVMILSIWLIWVFTTLKNSYKFLQDIKEKTMAINFARWWMEWVFSIRDTNWQRWSGKKDQCWLKINPLVDSWNDWCENDDWFASGYYILWITWEQQYFYLTKETNWFTPTWSINSDDWKYLLCKDSNWLINSCPNATWRPSDYFDSTLFFRQVRGWYLLDKHSDQFLKTCDKWTDTDSDTSIDCWWDTFKEKNFCVDVFYFDWVKKKVTFCSVLTNFEN